VSANVKCSQSHNPKNDVLKDYENRNPRNLTMLRLQQKPKGYDLDATPRHWWYQLRFRREGRHTTGLVVHQSGEEVLRASTSEWAVQSRLPSTVDRTAATTIGRLLALRCLQAGLTEVEVEKFIEEPTSSNLKAFLRCMQEGGVTLQEPFELNEKDFYDNSVVRPTPPWEVPEHEAERFPETEVPMQ